MTKIIETQIYTSLAPIRQFLKNESVTNIIIKNCNTIFVKNRGEKYKLVPVKFDKEESIRIAANQIARSLKRPLDSRNPLVDARLGSGDRVKIIIDPIYDGTYIAIRLFPEKNYLLTDMKKMGTIDENGMELLEQIMDIGLNTIISGGTDSGKTSMLGAMCELIRDDEVIVSIEDCREIFLSKDLWFPLESKEKMFQDDTYIGLKELVKTSLRMSPKWLILGEVRGEEIQSLLRAMNTGHSGICTIHSNSALHALFAMQRLIVSSSNITHENARDEISNTINIVVHMKKFPDEVIRISEIVAVNGLEGISKKFKYDQLYRYKIQEIKEGKYIGKYETVNKLKILNKRGVIDDN
jgi:pilus assembly protein CpaF